jgi:hypothetical protein
MARRIAIIDHNEHELLIEDVNEQELEEKYGGDEQAYINDNYTFEGDYSWDWITDTQYFPEGDPDPMEVEFTDWL